MNINWINKIWPWSQFVALRAEADRWHAMAKAMNEHRAFAERQEWSNKFYAFLMHTLGRDQMSNLAKEFNAIEESLYGFDGSLGRTDKDKAVFPAKGTGEVDPKIVGPVAQAFVRAAQKRQEEDK
jgi:hypothetical protein